MQILFLHDNFPAQFGPLGLYCAAQGDDVWFGTQRKGASLPGIKVFNYAPHRSVGEKVHPYAVNFERGLLAGQAVARAGLALREQGLDPDIVVAHSGWGPGLFAKDIWPRARYVGYFEWFYHAAAPDVVHLGGTRDPDDTLRTRARSATILLDLVSCDAALCPTAFQRDQFPADLRSRLTVMHDGIDTDYFAPPPAEVKGGGLSVAGADIPPGAEIITYVARGMEPYRGFPAFMAALESVLKTRPNAHAVLVGEDRVAYGRQLPAGESYKAHALAAHDLDLTRVHFMGLLPRADYRAVLAASSVHVYLTIPFVLSWSMLEAMAMGCAIVASDVAPVREIADQAPAALTLTPLDAPAVAASIHATLDAGHDERKAQGQTARAVIERNYAMREILPAKRDWLSALL